MCFLFHKWSQWSVISDRQIHYSSMIGSGILREIIQEKTCSVCNLKKYKVKDID